MQSKRKMMDYGLRGYWAPTTPRALRSARGKRVGLRKKVVEGCDEFGSFELLASVAGQILQEKEACQGLESKTSETHIGLESKDYFGTNNMEKHTNNVANATVKQEQSSSEENFDIGPCCPRSYADTHASKASRSTSTVTKSYSFRQVPGGESATELRVCSLSNFEKKSDTTSTEDNWDSKRSVVVGSEDGYANLSDESVFSAKNVAKKEMGFVESHEGKGENEIGESMGQWKENYFKIEKMEDGLESKGGDSMDLEVKTPPIDFRAAPLPATVGKAHICKDDDENSSRCNDPRTLPMKSFKASYRRDRKHRKSVASRFRKVVPQASSNVHDCSVSGVHSETKDLANDPQHYCSKGSNTRQKKSRLPPSKMRRLFEGNAFCASGSDRKDVNREPSSADGRLHDKSIPSPIDSSPAEGGKSSKRPGESKVKLSIKSFTVPDLFVDMPETATIGALKRAVMEAAIGMLGGGLRVRVLLHGKKVLEEGETLLQAGISHGCEMDAVGFMLEPDQVSSRGSPEDPLFLLSCAETQPLSLYPMTAASAPGERNSDCLKGRSSSASGNSVPSMTAEQTSMDPIKWEESDYDSVPSSAVGPDSGALIVLPPVNMDDVEGLALVPVNCKHRGSELVKRRIRRPFSVVEVEALVQAVEKLGTGRWRDVKLHAFDHAKHRTYVDLKDKWKTLVHTAKISPHQRRGEPVPQDLLDRVLSAHSYWSEQQNKQQQAEEGSNCMLMRELAMEA
ncbi:hypothetical protein AMTRI_Chr07g29400 [Amborella trichopoda]